MKIRKGISLFINHCKTIKKLSELTCNAYTHDLQCYRNYSRSTLDLSNVDKDHIYGYVKFLNQEGKAQATVKRRLACLKSFFKWLENEEIIPLSPFAKLSLKVKLPKKLPKHLSKHEIGSLNIQALKESSLATTKYHRAQIESQYNHRNINELNTLILVELLLTTGLRISELTSVEMHNVDINAQLLRINGKGQRERKVYLTDRSIVNLVSGYLRVREVAQPDHHNFLINSRKTPLSSQSARLLIRKLGEKTKLGRRITPHMYRHTAATQLLESGVDIRFVQKLLGHESIETTQIYTHVEDRALQEHIKSANIRSKVMR